jgi:hypothetical protein
MVAIKPAQMDIGVTDKIIIANVRLPQSNKMYYLACNEACTKCDGPLSS